MADSRHITRRAALSTFSAAAAMAAVPAMAAQCGEAICDKLERQCHDLSETLGEFSNGSFRALVGPDGDVVLQNVKLHRGGDSALMVLFKEWDALYHSGAASPIGRTDEDIDQLSDQMNDLEHRMAAIPATTMQELAAKIIADTSYGDFALGAGPTGNRVLTEIATLIT